MTTRTSVTRRRTGAGQPMSADDALRQDIGLRAYCHYRDRGGLPGFEIEDWLVAEREVLAERAKVPVDRSGRPKSAARAAPRPKPPVPR